MSNTTKKPAPARLRKGLVIAAVVLVVIVAIVGILSDFITDFLWFSELGLLSVFLKQLVTQLMLGVPIFVIITALSMFYLMGMRRGYYKRVEVVTEKMTKKTFRLISLGISVIAGLLVSVMVASTAWNDFLQLQNATSFDLKDPIFKQDIGFYVFKLDFIKFANDMIIIIIVLFAAITLIAYLLLLTVARPVEVSTSEDLHEDNKWTGNDNPTNNPFGKFANMFTFKFTKNTRVHVNTQGGASFDLKELVHIASKQLIALGLVFFFMLAVHFFLLQYQLLYANTGVLYGAGYTDINITLLIYRVMVGLSLLGLVIFTIGIIKRRARIAFSIPILMIALFVLGMLVSVIVQQFIVAPDERNKESKYMGYNIDFTQNAYDIGEVKVNAFPADNNLSTEEVMENKESIRNIRINDYDPAKTFYNQTQSIRQYYTFNDVDVDRYMIDGSYTQTFLSAREIDESKINQQWLNVHLKYTHGYGITLSRVDKVTSSGQPDMLIKDIPPRSDINNIKVSRPEIYFGELTDNYIITGTDEKEFDYPEGESNVYSKYEGGAGIKLNLFNRLLFAFQESSMKLLVSTNINDNSKIIINRNIAQRVRKIMPYLDYSDPYMVVVEGKLYWIIDAYTTSNKYPYSEPYNIEQSTNNYIRNSVKVVIDAYTGDTSYYLVDESDPVANTMKRIYPKLFKAADTMPDGLRAHIRYPSKLLQIQADVYKRYHVKDVNVFYQGEDLWAIAKEKLGAGEEDVDMKPNYYIMKLPGEEEVEFVNSIPYTPRDKNNLIGLLVARNDGKHYGELVLYQFPKTKTVLGPNQVDAQIAQDTQISQDFSLWENSGSTYSRGNMFVIPIESSLIYVEPIYLKAANSSLPEVKRVIVYYGDRIAYKPTLAEALNEMFGEGVGNVATDASSSGDADGGSKKPDDLDKPTDSTQKPTQAKLIADANAAYEAMIEAQKKGNWAEYGKQLDKLSDLLKQLQ